MLKQRSSVLDLVPPLSLSRTRGKKARKVTPLKRLLTRKTLTEHLSPISEANTQRTTQDEIQEQALTQSKNSEEWKKDRSWNDDEEQLHLKCEKNPFLRKKMLSELSSLNRSIYEPCAMDQAQNIEPLLQTQHILVDEMTTFKQIKKCQSESNLVRIGQFQHMMKNMGGNIRGGQS